MERREIQSELLARLFDYWDGLRKGADMPPRQELDPVDIPHESLPYVMLMEVEHDPVRFLIRLVGTRVTAYYGQEVTGQYLDRVDLGSMSAAIQDSYLDVVRSHRASVLRGEYQKSDGRHLKFERIALPLTLDGSHVDQILVGAVFEILEPGIERDGN